tara:strand:+ start:2265 stop:2774 length:510 start_codon:yes stop_codon:yes gene_type:complete
MFKKLIFILYIFLLFNIQNAFSDENIVYLDVNFIINKSKPAISIIKKIEKIKENETKQLKLTGDKLQKKNDELVKTKNLLSENELKNKVAKLREEIKLFEKKKIDIINNLNKKKTDELNDFLKLINPLIKSYMDKNSIDIVIDKKNIFIAKTDKDITKDILEIINSELK